MTNEEKWLGQEGRDAHALAVGKIVLAWNEYQETLGLLFAVLFQPKDQYALALAAWQALNNDRAQRSMLAEVARTKFKPEEKEGKEILWLVQRTDELISEQRNLGIHTPLMSLTDLEGTPRVLPQGLFGNKRAASMQGLDPFAEFAHYEEQIRKMTTYALFLQFIVSPKAKPFNDAHWPQRPQLAKRAPVVTAR